MRLHEQCTSVLKIYILSVFVPFSTFLFGTFRNVAMIEVSWKLQVLEQTSYNSEFYCAKVAKKARVYYAL